MNRISTGDHQFAVDEFPNKCPQCHHAIDPRHMASVLVRLEPMREVRVELVFQCPQRDCRRLFIGRYRGQYNPAQHDYPLVLNATTPYSPEPPMHSPEVAAVSPQFVDIFSEASAAERWSLKEVAGCGYRKALEFLVKDYCIGRAPEKAEEIKSNFLGQVIEHHVDDAGIKACAKRATWLGNDETHYVRKWADMDLANLKELLDLTESWITTVERTRKYLASMSG